MKNHQQELVHLINFIFGLAKIWILRVYKLDKPQMLKRSNGMLYANVDKPVKLEGKPVIPDNEFNKLKEDILNTK